MDTHAPDAPLPAPEYPPVEAELDYLVPMEGRPVNHLYDPPAGVEKENCRYEPRRVLIADGRAGPRTGLDREGFALWEAPTMLRDFTDEAVIRARYYPEVAALACAATGGRRGIVFDHLVRRRETGRPALGFGRSGDGSRPAAVGRVHNDYSEASGQSRLAKVLGEAAAREVGRYSIVNVWRSIGGPILDTPLAVCEAASVSARERVAAEIRYPDRIGEIYLLTYSPRHRWVYYSRMDNHEALVFKQYDAQAGAIARFVPHAAFDHPDTPPDAPLRRSIEARCLVLYD